MASLTIYNDMIRNSSEDEESEIGEEDWKDFDAMNQCIEEDTQLEGLISLLINNLNEKGKRVLIGKLREALTLGNVQGGKSTLNVGILDGMISDYVRALGYDAAYSIALEFYTSGDLKPKYMMGNGIKEFPEFFGVKLPKRLDVLSRGYKTPPRKKSKIGGSPYGGQIPGSEQVLTPGEMGGSPDPRDPFSERPDWDPDKVAEEFPDMDEDVLDPSSNLCPSCVTGLCDTHIQLRF